MIPFLKLDHQELFHSLVRGQNVTHYSPLRRIFGLARVGLSPSLEIDKTHKILDSGDNSEYGVWQGELLKWLRVVEHFAGELGSLFCHFV